MSNLTDSEQREECYANLYEDYLKQAHILHKINQFIGLLDEYPLTDEEHKLIDKMITERDYLGSLDVRFQDCKDNI